MMKKKFVGIAASFLAVTGTGWFASGAQADNSTQNFILVSNRTGDDFGNWGTNYNVCVQLNFRSTWPAGSSQCKIVGVRDKAIWWYNPVDVAQVVLTGADRTFTANGPGNYCFRISGSGALHPADDGPCTSD
jgi:hypothetical protein